MTPMPMGSAMSSKSKDASTKRRATTTQKQPMKTASTQLTGMTATDNA